MFSKATSNKICLPILRQAGDNSNKIIVINPVPNYSTQEHLDFIKDLVRNLQPDSSVKLIVVYSVEASGEFESNREAFNNQIRKLVAGIDRVVFIDSNQVTGEGMINGVGGDAYVQYNKKFVIPPNLRVNFNLLLNYYCNRQVSIQNMKINDTNCCV